MAMRFLLLRRRVPSRGSLRDLGPRRLEEHEMNDVARQYPKTVRERNRWIVAQREERNPVESRRPYAFLVEKERGERGSLVDVVTLFLTNKECPWRCFMCDLWKNTLEFSVPPGAIPQQIDHAFEELSIPSRPEDRSSLQLKLYNSGSFFDPKAIPATDYEAIAERTRGFDRLIVESHPRLVGDRCLSWGRRVDLSLEVAIGLETVHGDALAQLNKGFTLEEFRRAASRLRDAGISLRVFLLVNPPFVKPSEQTEWALRTVAEARRAGATAICLIPTRQNSGALGALTRAGSFAPTSLKQLEDVFDLSLDRSDGRVFTDLWDLEEFSRCALCFERRRARLERMNAEQVILPRIECENCNGA